MPPRASVLAAMRRAAEADAAANSARDAKTNALVEQVTAMGFTDSHARAAVPHIDLNADNALETAIDWMASNPDPGPAPASSAAPAASSAAASASSAAAAPVPSDTAEALFAALARRKAKLAVAKKKHTEMRNARLAAEAAAAAGAGGGGGGGGRGTPPIAEVDDDDDDGKRTPKQVLQKNADGDDGAAAPRGRSASAGPVASASGAAAADDDSAGAAPAKPVDSSAGAGGGGGSGDHAQVKAITDMGFAASDARAALERTSNNVLLALQWLLNDKPDAAASQRSAKSSPKAADRGRDREKEKEKETEKSEAKRSNTPPKGEDPRTLRFGAVIGLQNHQSNRYLGVTTMEQAVSGVSAPGSARKGSMAMLGLVAASTSPPPHSLPRDSPLAVPPVSAGGNRTLTPTMLRASSGTPPAGDSAATAGSVSAIAAAAVAKTVAASGGGGGSMSAGGVTSSPTMARASSAGVNSVTVSGGGVAATSLQCDKWCRLVIVNPDNTKDTSLVLPKQRIALQTVDGTFIAFESNGDVKATRHAIAEGDFSYWTMTDIRASAVASAKPKPLLTPVVVTLDSPTGHALMIDGAATGALVATALSANNAAASGSVAPAKPNSARWRVIHHPEPGPPPLTAGASPAHQLTVPSSPSLSVSISSPVRKSSFGFSPPSPSVGGGDSSPSLSAVGPGAIPAPLSLGSQDGAAPSDEKSAVPILPGARGRWQRLKRQFRFVAMRCIQSHLSELSESLDKQRKDLERKAAEDRTCVVCLDKLPDTVMLECGHLGVCHECTPGLKQCPLCRQDVTRVITIRPSPSAS